jgi:tetratricopeptide (TPR) repeat protein
VIARLHSVICDFAIVPNVTLLLALVVLPARWALASAQTPPPSRPAAKSQSAPTQPDVATVERRLLDAVVQRPDSFEAQQMLAAFYLHQGQLAKAIPHLQRARAIDPTHYATGYDLAVALIQTGQADAARTHVKQMLAARETGELHNLLGDVEQQAGNLRAAAEEYQVAAHMDASEEHLFDWGDSVLRIGMREAAIEVFTAAVARQPKSARLYVGLGIAQYSQGQYADAVKSFCAAVDLSPADPRPYQFLGEMYGVAPELSDEISPRLARFVKAQPGNALAHLYYAMSLWKGSRSTANPADLKSVETHLRRAVTIDPRLAKGFLELGVLLSDQQRYAEAIPELRQAAKLDASNPQPHYRLARAYQSTGQRALAAKELEIFEQLKAAAREQ